MSWCPKCKNEYRAGITICPECNEELLEELNEEAALEFVQVIQTADLELKTKIMKYLRHCGHKVQEQEEEKEVEAETEQGITTELMYSILVPKDDYQEAMLEISTVLSYDEKENNETDSTSHRNAPEPSTLYVEAKERYSEYKSTGIMFLVFSAIFLVFGFLNVAKVISIMAHPVSLVLVFGMAVFFLYVGITSLAKVSSLREEAAAEEHTKELINHYLKEKFPKEKLVSMKEEKNVDSEELLYFQQMKLMKEDLSTAFPLEDENYLDALLEEYYNSIEM